jgi:hypothetical protein
MVFDASDFVEGAASGTNDAPDVGIESFGKFGSDPALAAFCSEDDMQ